MKKTTCAIQIFFFFLIVFLRVNIRWQNAISVSVDFVFPLVQSALCYSENDFILRFNATIEQRYSNYTSSVFLQSFIFLFFGWCGRNHSLALGEHSIRFSADCFFARQIAWPGRAVPCSVGAKDGPERTYGPSWKPIARPLARLDILIWLKSFNWNSLYLIVICQSINIFLNYIIFNVCCIYNIILLKLLDIILIIITKIVN